MQLIKIYFNEKGPWYLLYVTKFDILLFSGSLENLMDKTILLKTLVKVIGLLVLESRLDCVCLSHQIENRSRHNGNIAINT